MKIDKSKFTAEELAQYEMLIQKAIVEEENPELETEKNNEKEPELKLEEKDNSAMQKSTSAALERLFDSLSSRMAQLEKSLELKELSSIAAKYECLGEKPEELVKTLYELKKSDEAGYQAYLAALNKACAFVQKSGLFSEIGKSSHGSVNSSTATKIHAIAADLQKADPSLNTVAATAKAWEQHPELILEYEETYGKQR